MIYIVLASRNFVAFADLVKGLSRKKEVNIIQARSGKEVFQYIQEMRVDVVVADEDLADTTGLEMISELVKKYPMLNCALVSRLTADEFHETTEGLGLFMQLPPTPGEEEGGRMLEILASIGVLLKFA